jgi:nucleotide-binding universal stress UspA family protein
MFKNILIGIDGSEHSYHAAQVAGDLARSIKADMLWVVICYDPIPSYMGESILEKEIAKKIMESEKIMAKALEVIGTIPGELQTQIIEGPPAEAILSVADTRNNDLIIMGTRGLGALTGLLIGSQSQKVISHAKCPVLLVR